MKVMLVMFKSDGTRREFPVRPGGFVIGRKNNCDLRIPLSSVSRQHCVVLVEGDAITLKDAGSSNGTFHNNIRVTEAMLAAGDEVVVGPVVFTVVIDGKPAKIEPVRTLVENTHGLDDSVILPTDMLEQMDGDDSSIDDTLHDAEDEDPMAALDMLAEFDLPDSDVKS